MKKNTYNLALLVFAVSLLTGCGTITRTVIEKIEVPLPIPCNIVPPQKPVMPFSETGPSEDIFDNVKRLLAEIQERIGYEVQLEAAIKACNSK